jgi:hypothetical protein
MSNPAVIILVDVRTKSGGSFRVEDNIGEAIHIHYDNMRIDFSVADFLRFCEAVEESVNEIVAVDSFSANLFDPLFLHQISSKVTHLEKITFDKMNLDDLVISRQGLLGVPQWDKLSGSRVYKALQGDPKENDNYSQENFWNMSNGQRVSGVQEMIKEKGYPFNNEMIVLFNDQNYILDGQHRAAILWGLKGNISVPVMRLYFKGNRFTLSKRRWLKSFTPVMKSKLKANIKKILRKTKSLQKRIFVR